MRPFHYIKVWGGRFNNLWTNSCLTDIRSLWRVYDRHQKIMSCNMVKKIICHPRWRWRPDKLRVSIIRLWPVLCRYLILSITPSFSFFKSKNCWFRCFERENQNWRATGSGCLKHWKNLWFLWKNWQTTIGFWVVLSSSSSSLRRMVIYEDWFFVFFE